MTPARRLHPCLEPGCPRLVQAGRCPLHARSAWTNSTGVTPARIRGRKLQRLRKRLFKAHPLCVACQARGRVSIATIRDHVIPLSEGGADDESNVQALCRACSDVKTHDEAARGRQRAVGGWSDV